MNSLIDLLEFGLYQFRLGSRLQVLRSPDVPHGLVVFETAGEGSKFRMLVLRRPPWKLRGSGKAFARYLRAIDSGLSRVPWEPNRFGPIADERRIRFAARVGPARV